MEELPFHFVGLLPEKSVDESRVPAMHNNVKAMTECVSDATAKIPALAFKHGPRLGLHYFFFFHLRVGTHASLRLLM